MLTAATSQQQGQYVTGFPGVPSLLLPVVQWWPGVPVHARRGWHRGRLGHQPCVSTLSESRVCTAHTVVHLLLHMAAHLTSSCSSTRTWCKGMPSIVFGPAWCPQLLHQSDLHACHGRHTCSALMQAVYVLWPCPALQPELMAGTGKCRYMSSLEEVEKAATAFVEHRQREHHAAYHASSLMNSSVAGDRYHDDNR